VKDYRCFWLCNQKPTAFGIFQGIIVHLRDPVILKLGIGAFVGMVFLSAESRNFAKNAE